MQISSDSTLVRSHPRLVLTRERLAQLKQEVQNDSFARTLLARLERHADRFLQEPPAIYQLEGRRLLGVSRRVLAQVLHFALLGRLTEDERYIAAARKTMLSAASFPDWNPSHFLDVAEMAMALAAGYDWLYDSLTPLDRETIEAALIDKALRPSLEQDWFWISGQNNWNPVCHAGLVFAAIAVEEKEPQLAKTIIDRAKANIGKVAGAYGPDGAYDEGPMYWDYGTSFLVLLCAALESSTGQPFDPNIPGLLPSADFMTHAVGPGGDFYNYSDCRLNRSPTAALFWFARKLDKPSLADRDRQLLNDDTIPAAEGERLLPFALIWNRPAVDRSTDVLPTCWIGGGRSPVALMRTRWGDPNASFLGIKGGSPSTSHGHMDVGSFVFESDGIRWAMDLPMQDYHSLEAAGVNLWDGSPDGQRWQILRNGAEGHGIIRFNAGAQAVHASAVLQAVPDADAIGKVVLNLSELYPGVTKSVSRMAQLNPDGSGVLEDRWQAGEEDLVVDWQWITAADIDLRPSGFRLRSGPTTLDVTLDAFGSGLLISAVELDQLRQPFDAPIANVKRITARLHTPRGGKGRMLARLVPKSLQN